MRPQRNRLLLAAALAVLSVLAVWIVCRENAPPRASSERHARPNRDRPADRQKTSRSTIGKPVRVLSNDDLTAIYHREGAAAALAAAKSQPWPDRDNRVGFILTHLAAGNPEFAAAELKLSGLPSFFKDTVVDKILKNWKDGRKALDWAENQLTGELRCKAVAGALGILVKSEPDAAFDYFAKLPPGETQRQTLPELFAAWGFQDRETALMRANGLTPEDASSATEHVLRGWAMADPAAAAVWILKTASTDGNWLAGVYQSWICISPEQARLWFESLPEGDAKKNAFTLTHSPGNSIEMPVFSTRVLPPDHSWISKPIPERTDTDLSHWARQDTEGARSFVEQNENNPASKQLAAQVARAISGKNGPSEALDWALGLSEENGIREQARWIVLHEWSEKDPEAAAGKLASLHPNQIGTLPIMLVDSWAKQDPAAAADWVAGWKGDYQANMVEGVIDRWTKQDPQAAYQWLGTLPAGIGRDFGIRAMIRGERGSAPDTLQPWIDLISDSQLREKTRRELE
jgi:hypothetical protein